MTRFPRLWKHIAFAVLVTMILGACGQGATPAVDATEPSAEEPTEAMAEEPTEAMAEEPAEMPELTITWLVWPPCDALAELVAEYPDADVRVNCVPFPQWHDAIFNDFVSKSGVDLPIIDSQWTGEANAGGHLMELTDFLEERTDFDQWLDPALTAYAEYPEDSGQYWGMPIFVDVQLIAYNKNILAEYDYDAPADTWEGLVEQAQTIKAGGEYDGWVWFYNPDDQIQTAYNQIAWSRGGELWDPETYSFEGVINSPENLEALEMLIDLYEAGPEGAGNFSFGEVTTAMCDGTAAMTSMWVAILTGWTDPATCAEYPNMGFAIPPRGPEAHVLSLGGMGINVSAYTEHPEAALDFLEWLGSEETQLRWAELGGSPGRADVLASETYRNAAPFNPLAAEAFSLLKDFYRIPEYYALEVKEGEYLNLAVTGQMPPQEALDELAKDSQAIIDEAYPEGPPQ